MILICWVDGIYWFMIGLTFELDLMADSKHHPLLSIKNFSVAFPVLFAPMYKLEVAFQLHTYRAEYGDIKTGMENNLF